MLVRPLVHPRAPSCADSLALWHCCMRLHALFHTAPPACRPHEYVMQMFQNAGNRPLRSVIVPPDAMIRESLMKAMLVSRRARQRRAPSFRRTPTPAGPATHSAACAPACRRQCVRITATPPPLNRVPPPACPGPAARADGASARPRRGWRRSHHTRQAVAAPPDLDGVPRTHGGRRLVRLWAAPPGGRPHHAARPREQEHRGRQAVPGRQPARLRGAGAARDGVATAVGQALPGRGRLGLHLYQHCGQPGRVHNEEATAIARRYVPDATASAPLLCFCACDRTPPLPPHTRARAHTYARTRTFIHVRAGHTVPSFLVPPCPCPRYPVPRSPFARSLAAVVPACRGALLASCLTWCARAVLVTGGSHPIQATSQSRPSTLPCATAAPSLVRNRAVQKGE